MIFATFYYWQNVNKGFKEEEGEDEFLHKWESFICDFNSSWHEIIFTITEYKVMQW